MGSNVREGIQLHLCRVIQVSAETSYTFIQRHPLVSGALSVFFILYIFLSYIFNFLVYLSPFLVCTAIFVRIFWSSEQSQITCVKGEEEKKREEERVESKYPKIAKNVRREVLYKYPSQNATSRRRNFSEKKRDVYGDSEEKAKDLSAVFCNDFTRKITDIKDVEFPEKEASSLDCGLSEEKDQDPERQNSVFESSKLCDGCGDSEKVTKNIEDRDDKDEKGAQEDRNKAAEGTKDDQKNPVDLGISALDRNRRLESLIARRRARKLLKVQIENGLIDIKSATPSQLAPLLIQRVNPFDSPKDLEGFDSIEWPGSAPSLRSPFDLPYDPFEEKPDLTGDSFQQEFTSHQKDMPFCRHESFSLGLSHPRVSDRLAYPRVTRLPDKGIEQLCSKGGGEIGSKAPNPLGKGEEATHEDGEKCKTDVADMKDEELENAHARESMSDHTREPGSTPNISNVESASVSEKLGPRVPKPHERIFNFPLSSPSPTTTTNNSLYVSIPSPRDKNQENMLFTNRRNCHTPTYSIASDLQVEVSDIGSPTLTVDERHEIETNTSSDGESSVYDGDIDRDITSGSEDMWGASLHSRGVRGLGEEDIEEAGFAESNQWRDIASSTPLQHIDEENAADVSSMSSISDMHDDTPTAAINNDQNIFGNVKYYVGETEAPQPYNSSHATSRWKRLMNSPLDRLRQKARLKRQEEWCHQSKNLTNEAQVINDVNNSAAVEQDNTENSESNDEPGAAAGRQEEIDEVSTNSVASSSPRSIVSGNTIADQVSLSANTQQMHTDVRQSNMEDIAQETLNGEGPLDQQPTYFLENSNEESNMFGKMNHAEVCYKEDEERLKNGENCEDKSSPLVRQVATAESPGLAETTTSEDMNEKSRDSVYDKVSLISLMLESSSEAYRENEDKSQASMRQEATMEPFINAEATSTSSAEDFEGKHSDLNKNEDILPGGSTGESDKLRETDKPLKSESKEVVEDDKEKEKLDRGDIAKDSPLPVVTEVTSSRSTEDTIENSEKENKNESVEQELDKNETMVLSESVGGRDEARNEAQMKEHGEVLQLEDVNAPKLDEPNDSSKEVGHSQRKSARLVEDDTKKEKPAGGDDNEDLPPQPRVIEPTIPSKEADEGLAGDS